MLARTLTSCLRAVGSALLTGHAVASDVARLSPDQIRAPEQPAEFVVSQEKNSYLTMTDMLRQRVPLQITRKGTKGTFWTVCLPVFAYHPAFRAERVYFGEATIAKLTNVFVLTFKRRLALSGDRTKRNTVAKIKFLKRALEAEDRLLGEVLENAVAAGHDVHCFMHVTELPELKMHGTKQRAWFVPSARDHVFIIPVSMVTVVEGVSDRPENVQSE